MKRQAGFTLIELLVAIALIGILASVIFVNLNDSYSQGRDTERKGDLRALEAALERYRLKNGHYPEGCNGPNDWSGQQGTDYECTSGSQYIVDLAPEFIPALPIDPRLNGTNSGYVYTVDENGDVYKLMALNTVESEEVSMTDEFARCGNIANIYHECTNVPNNPTGNWAYNSRGGTPTQCNSASEYQNDYAIRAGFASGGTFGVYRDTPQAQEYFSDQVRCK